MWRRKKLKSDYRLIKKKKRNQSLMLSLTNLSFIEDKANGKC